MGQLQAKGPQTLSREVVRYFGVNGKRLTGKRTAFRDERAVAVEMIYRYAGISPVEIGRMFGGLDLHSGEPGARLRRRIEEKAALSKAVRIGDETAIKASCEHLEGIFIGVEAYIFVRSPPRTHS